MNDPKKRTTGNSKTKQNQTMFGRWLLLIVCIVFGFIIVRFSYVSISKTIGNVNLSDQAKRLYTDNKTIKAQRGSILDQDGQPIAEDTSTYSVYAVLNKNQVGPAPKKVPLYVTDKEKTARVLSKYLPLSYSKILKILNPTNSKAFQVEFGNAGKNLSVATKEKIESKHLSGINFVSSEARLYPNGVFASNLIGLSQTKQDKNSDVTQLNGIMGIERTFNNKLTGADGERSLQKDKFGYQLPGSQVERPAVNGETIYTTLDSRLQSIMETQVSKVEEITNANSMNATIINAKTGAILATTQRPTFNAATKKGLDKSWRDGLVQDTFEPGSTMKLFTVSSAVDSGHFNPDATYESGTYAIDGKIIPDWKRSGWGQITYKKGFALSSNVAMAHLERKMGAATWKKYIKRFRLLKSTNSGLPVESSGSMAFTYPIDQANTAFGQGINVTTMQMLQGFTAVANDGKMVKPQFIKKIINPNTGKTTYSMKTEDMGTPIKASSAKEVRNLMQDVVYKPYGIGQDFKIKGYRVAAKTGTAQVASSNGTGYLMGDNSYLYSVVGMVPAKQPKYIMYVTMKQPTLPGTQTPTQLLNQVFGPVMKQALEQDTTTAKDQLKTTVRMPNLIGEDAVNAKRDLGKQNVAATILGSGKEITQQSIDADTKIMVGQRVILLTNGQVLMPDLKGWSKNDVVNLAQLLNLPVQFKGSGFVTQQSMATGSTVVSGQGQLVVTLK